VTASNPELVRSKRILLKISGEFLCGKDASSGVDPSSAAPIIDEIAEAARSGVEIALVVGAGNLIRGKQLAGGLDPVAADMMGMLATVINAVAVCDLLNTQGINASVLNALGTFATTEAYNPFEARKRLDCGEVVILAGGTANPYVTTDTTAVIRALEIKADLCLKATKVDGVYSADPLKDPSAKRFKELTYDEVLERALEVMDLTAITLARSENLALVVFSLREQGNLKRVIEGKDTGTRIKGGQNGG